MNNINFQYYPARVNSTRPLGFVNVPEFVKANKSPAPNIREVFKQIAQAEALGDMKLKAKLKQENLFYFTPCVFSNGNSRKYSDINHFTGLAVMDFDHIENAEDFRDYIFNTFNFVVVAFVSPSKKGIKVLVKIPKVETVEEFKAYFYGLGVLFDKFKGWDGTPQNAVLPLFLSVDKDIKYRSNPATFTDKGVKVDSFYNTKTVNIKDVKVSPGDAAFIYSNVEKSFNKIVDNGHPQVIASCIVLGGYAGAGYISISEAEAWAENFIKTNDYLKKGISGYIKTSRTAIKKGMQSPLNLNQN